MDNTDLDFDGKLQAFKKASSLIGLGIRALGTKYSICTSVPSHFPQGRTRKHTFPLQSGEVLPTTVLLERVFLVQLLVFFVHLNKRKKNNVLHISFVFCFPFCQEWYICIYSVVYLLDIDTFYT